MLECNREKLFSFSHCGREKDREHSRLAVENIWPFSQNYA